MHQLFIANGKEFGRRNFLATTVSLAAGSNWAKVAEDAEADVTVTVGGLADPVVAEGGQSTVNLGGVDGHAQSKVSNLELLFK